MPCYKLFTKQKYTRNTKYQNRPAIDPQTKKYLNTQISIPKKERKKNPKPANKLAMWEKSVTKQVGI